MKKIDRVILAVIAAALTVIAMNPWVAPTSSQAQSGKVDVNIVEIAGVSLANHYLKSKISELEGIPVITLNK